MKPHHAQAAAWRLPSRSWRPPRRLFPRAELDAIRLNGWLVGVALGVALGVWLVPSVRQTVLAQVGFALTDQRIGWFYGRDPASRMRDVARLNATAADHPDDYLIQLGRATVLADLEHNPQSDSPSAEMSGGDRSLLRLAVLAARLPASAGAYAHFARHMLIDRFRIERPLAARRGAHPAPVRHTDVDLMVWALRAGARRDPDNAFWPAMLAVTYAAARHDNAAVAELTLAAHKTRWDSYVYEEVVGQWRLYSAAYGDRGAAQKVSPLTVIAFPHLGALRRFAEIARSDADRLAHAGDLTEAARIRLNIAWLGRLIRDSAPWSLEALYGTDLILIATTEPDARSEIESVSSVTDWDRLASPFLASLQPTYYRNDGAWLRNQVDESLDLRRRVGVARYDASYPGIPPGIPLAPLFGDWMAGVCALRQLMLLIAAAVIVAVWRGGSVPLERSRPVRTALLVAGLVIALAACAVGLAGLPSSLLYAAIFCQAAILMVIAIGRIHARWPRPILGAWPRVPIEAFWSTRTSLVTAGIVTAACISGMLCARPLLASLHPVAVALTAISATERYRAQRDAVVQAALACAMPAALALTAAVIGLLRGYSPAASAIAGIRKMALPAVACLVVGYLALLNRTIVMDSTASRAIEAAAQSDLQWVLTHTEPEDD